MRQATELLLPLPDGYPRRGRPPTQLHGGSGARASPALGCSQARASPHERLLPLPSGPGAAGRSARQPELEDAAPAGPGREAYLAGLNASEGGAERETEPGSGFGFRCAGRVTAGEAVEDAAPLRLGYSLPLVSHLEEPPWAVPGSAEAH